MDEGRRMRVVSAPGVVVFAGKEEKAAAATELRRSNSSAWRHDSEGGERGKRERVEGVYREGSGCRLMALIAGNQGEQFLVKNGSMVSGGQIRKIGVVSERAFERE